MKRLIFIISLVFIFNYFSNGVFAGARIEEELMIGTDVDHLELPLENEELIEIIISEVKRNFTDPLIERPNLYKVDFEKCIYTITGAQIFMGSLVHAVIHYLYVRTNCVGTQYDSNKPLQTHEGSKSYDLELRTKLKQRSPGEWYIVSSIKNI